MRMGRSFILGLGVSLALAGAAFAATGGPGGEMPMPPDGFWSGRSGGLMGPGGPGMVGPDRMLDSLDLSATQKERLKELRRARRERIQKLANSFDDAREDFEDLLNGSARGADFEQKIRAKHAEMVALQQSLDGQIFESILEVRGLLSAAQLKKFNELHKNMAFRGPGIGRPMPWGLLPGRLGEHEDGK